MSAELSLALFFFPFYFYLIYFYLIILAPYPYCTVVRFSFSLSITFLVRTFVGSFAGQETQHWNVLEATLSERVENPPSTYRACALLLITFFSPCLSFFLPFSRRLPSRLGPAKKK